MSDPTTTETAEMFLRQRDEAEAKRDAYRATCHTLIAQRDAYKAALAELVRLKDHPQHDELTDEKRAAWEAARSVLAGVVSTREKDK